MTLAALIGCATTASAQIEDFEDPDDFLLYELHRPPGSGWINNLAYAGFAAQSGSLGVRFLSGGTPGYWYVRPNMGASSGGAYYAMIKFPTLLTGEAFFGAAAGRSGAIIVKAVASTRRLSLHRQSGWNGDNPATLAFTTWPSNPPSQGWFRLQIRWNPNGPGARGELLNEAGTVLLAATAYVDVGGSFGDGILIKGYATSGNGVLMDSIGTGNCPAPVITTQPLDQEVCSGAVAHFSVAATTGLGPLQYQWYRNGVPISGATSATLNYLTGVADFPSDIHVAVMGPCGQSTSATVQLTSPLTIEVAPKSATDCETTHVFTVEATGAAPISYLWSGPGIVGPNDGASILVNQSGAYSCTVQNSECSVTTPAATWTSGLIEIMSEPSDTLACVGSSASISLSATNAEQYAWFKDGQPLVDGGRISGATTAALHFQPSSATDEGQYHCRLSNPCGAQLSETVVLRVRDSGQAKR